jgi:hypothetical protein
MKYATYGTEPAGQWSEATDLGCVDGSANDTLSRTQRRLIDLGCSNPVYWTGYRNGWIAHSVMQMCPYSQSVDDVIYNLGGVPMADGGKYGRADTVPYQSWGFSDAKVLHPPFFYYWVVPWQCPSCPSGACMSPMPETGHDVT